VSKAAIEVITSVERRALEHGGEGAAGGRLAGTRR
jgi:hypothetical protein